MNAKQAAARHAVSLIRSGMIVGMGSGSTVDCAIELFGQRVRDEGLQTRLVVASSRSEAACRKAGLTPETLCAVERLDFLIDGADEFDPEFNLLKGGGGALVREKLLAVCAREFVVVADAAKATEALGAFPLPVAILPFGARHTVDRLARLCPNVSLRQDGEQPLVTDDGLWVVDMRWGRIDDPRAVERDIRAQTGVVDVGLFLGLAHRVIVGYADGRTEEVERCRG